MKSQCNASLLKLMWKTIQETRVVGFPATILCGTVNLLAERRIATMATYSPPPSRVDVEEALSSAQEKRARIHEPQHMHSHEIIREW